MCRDYVLDFPDMPGFPRCAHVPGFPRYAICRDSPERLEFKRMQENARGYNAILLNLVA
jgi:hypothetical protein